jgi:hypothetical protein
MCGYLAYKTESKAHAKILRSGFQRVSDALRRICLPGMQTERNLSERGPLADMDLSISDRPDKGTGS